MHITPFRAGRPPSRTGGSEVGGGHRELNESVGDTICLARVSVRHGSF